MKSVCACVCVCVYALCIMHISMWSFPGGSSSKESTCQCTRCRFNPWVGKIPWRGKLQPVLTFLPGKSHEQRSLVDIKNEKVLILNKCYRPAHSLLLLFSCSVTSNSLQLHGERHTRLPCPSLSCRVCSNSCPLSQ